MCLGNMYGVIKPCVSANLKLKHFQLVEEFASVCEFAIHLCHSVICNCVIYNTYFKFSRHFNIIAFISYPSDVCMPNTVRTVLSYDVEKKHFKFREFSFFYCFIGVFLMRISVCWWVQLLVQHCCLETDILKAR